MLHLFIFLHLLCLTSFLYEFCVFADPYKTFLKDFVY